ncbi:TetR family transcriptional regulator [Isoptericola halotolerans]|uniref:DNA-binding transcriptional regulator YbjK n=1 Tax=Isoptericola halotolerans TaxID=300560 RepID=A0ABX1ZYF3_9MICO|nr:DNA-binding transcriptional regulator YbjK [Isoptericola halotolerans]
MSGTRRQAPNDPGRKDRILDATLEVVARDGVHGTTHRRIAAAAEVPLGSMTYYFDGMSDLLAQAFARLADTMSLQYRRMLEDAADTAEAETAVVDLICGQAYATHRELTLIFEMYAYANHHPEVRSTMHTWLLRSRESLGLHFPEHVCRALDALVEGWPMHRSFDDAPLDRDLVAATVHAVVTGLGGAAPAGRA